MYGTDPSESGLAAAEAFVAAGHGSVLELGAGQGRDTFYLARQGLHVTALDFAPGTVETLRSKACMAFTTGELERLAGELRRVLRPGGLVVYTARTTADAHFGAGISRGDDMYENGGFIVHFFDQALIDRLAAGFELLDVTDFSEGELPRRLAQVTMRVLPQ